MAEHDSEREPEEKGALPGERRGDSRDESSGGPDEPGGEQHVPFDEAAAWQAIVAGYGEEPPDPPGARPFRSVEDLALLESEPDDTSDKAAGKPPEKPSDKASEKSTGESSDKSLDKGLDNGVDKKSDNGSDKPADQSADEAGPSATKPLGSSITFAPGVGSGPRDYQAPEPSEDDFDEDDEGHFIPPEPPPLPAADATAKFAWLGVLGGPVLLLLAVLLGWDMTWWLATLGIGGFLGGFATLVMRMKGDDEDDDDPGRGAVV
ncbi:hypothetical protein [Streptomyces acidicola]|uniref:DUF308 domain-containing protein n=1 Tax=Streptomyces acidicola TaxID=2596892 RepID=A0A5N8WXS8_9ACTN|nr:hypothetical protein [Streptomyces acidicola]MPY51504.1 hypothetical protein [Streptomyces acidicola]